MDVTIREYREEDLENLTSMMQALVSMMAERDPHKRFRSGEDFDATSYTNTLLENVSKADGMVYFAEADGQPVGCIVGSISTLDPIDRLNKYETKQGYIDALYVDDAYRGKGVADALVTSMETYFRAQGCLYSSVSCIAANDQARSFYAKQGYGEQYVDFLKSLKNS